MIYRVVFLNRLDGPMMSLEGAVLRHRAHAYPDAVPVDELHELPHGVAIAVGSERFTVPWANVKFTNGDSAAEAPEDFKPEMLRIVSEHRAFTDAMNEHTPPAVPEFDPRAKPCPACVDAHGAALAIGQPIAAPVPNRRAACSFLCVEHNTDEMIALYRKAK